MPTSAASFVLWSVDSLEKVAREAEPANGADRIVIESCRSEFTSAQVAVRASRPLPDLRASISPLKHEEIGATGIEVQARFVGYVPVTKNTPDTPEEELTCTAPCQVPDLLLTDETLCLEANSTQPIWLTFFIPPDAPPGRWRGAVEITAAGDAVQLPLQLTVHPITPPATRHLSVTNWMDMGNFASHYATETYTPRFWQVVESFARNMGAHRQNVILCPNELVHIYQEDDGALAFDYSDYDRWLQIFADAGCADLIEGGHLGRRGLGKWETPWFEWRQFRVRRRDGAEVKPDPEAVIRALVPSLITHVKERGWFDRFLLHVVDEPAPHTEEDYKKKARLVRELAPGVPLLEAMSLMDARGLLDIWVPQLSHFDEHRDNYLSMRDQAGIELWFYTCMYPTGRYPNRFLDFSLLKTRILHWINWRYRLTGYLHWGLNFWTDDPFHQDRIRDDLPPGDCWIVYPGPDGPLDSLRWEQMREGIQDFELLWLLDHIAKEAGRGTDAADKICAGLLPDPVTYTRDFRALRAARRAAIEALLALQT
ncbi:MAG: DUF4091 domain-containing protein [Armatimonadota bacterium]|nr:MAG: DUF4091 domain-containing protein [Armatimonadota bacterium]